MLPVLTGHADQLKVIFDEGDELDECKQHDITMLAGPGAIVGVHGTGEDALQAASDAINKASHDTASEPTAAAVLVTLRGGLEVNGPDHHFTLKDHKITTFDQIQIVEAPPEPS